MYSNGWMSRRSEVRTVLLLCRCQTANAYPSITPCYTAHRAEVRCMWSRARDVFRRLYLGHAVPTNHATLPYLALPYLSYPVLSCPVLSCQTLTILNRN